MAKKGFFQASNKMASPMNVATYSGSNHLCIYSYSFNLRYSFYNSIKEQVV